ncbi:hypothetical protein IFM89_020459 [Coptis chinensis]|uniref:Cytochrome P450 n=1 Tax=Coptis chinensis TaxID=261450 RepID=A0A835H7T3_9MAGN|nr:hypothetical protein IFM89_020459 [Coptis chinensis]
MMGTWTAALFIAFLAGLWFVLYHLSSSRDKNCSSSLPPGPLGLPLIGHLHMLGVLPHHNLRKMAKKYGPIMSIRLGLIPTIVVSSPGFAELFLKTHDLVFASRPKFLAAEYMSYGQKNLGAAPYGQYWRNIRKLCTLELLSNSKVEFFKSMRREDLVNFVESLRTTAQDGSLIDISAKVESLINDVMYRMVVGLKDDRFKLKPNIQEGVRLAGLFNFADYIPYVGALDLQGLGRRMKAVSKMVDELLDKIIEEHLSDAKEVQGTHMDFIDVMLSLIEANDSRKLHLGRDHVKAITLDMLAAGMHTSSTTVEWVIAELLKHPRVMKLVQEELQRVVGLDRMVEETDFIKLDYMKMVIKGNHEASSSSPIAHSS